MVVTNGTAEANYIAIWRLVEPGDEVVMMLPNYMQIWGVVRGAGRHRRALALREEDGLGARPRRPARGASRRARA